MEARERQAMEAEFILKISQLTEEQVREWIDFMEWLKENHPTDEEATAEIERRMRIYES